MKQFLLFTFILAVSFQWCYAQVGSLPSGESGNKNQVKNAIYFELLGNGGIYSVNYERRFGEQLWGRSGASYFPAAYDGLATLPVGLSYLFGKQAKFFELGLGTTLFYAASDDYLFNFDDDDSKVFSAGITATIGYRFQPPEKDLFFKAALIPAYVPVSSAFGVSAGLSFGYSF
jgi:hypothetical protein